mgnify:CR=1 FL=1
MQSYAEKRFASDKLPTGAGEDSFGEDDDEDNGHISKVKNSMHRSVVVDKARD